MTQPNTGRPANPVASGAGLDIPELQGLTDARDALAHAQQPDMPAARLDVQTAAEAARDAGCAWSQIGDVLGIARGNAYQRYRRRPHLVPRADAPPL
jgi:hypothetical protein